MCIPKNYYTREITPDFLRGEDRIMYNALLMLWGKVHIARLKFSRIFFNGKNVSEKNDQSVVYSSSEDFHLGDFCVSSQFDAVKIGNFFILDGNITWNHVHKVCAQYTEHTVWNSTEPSRTVVAFYVVVFVVNYERFLV